MVPGIVGEGEDTNKLYLGFARIAHYLDPEQPLYTLKPRRALTDEHNFPSVDSIAADYIQAIQALQPEGPYVLGGDCVGGVIAYEMAQQLTKQLRKVELLFLLDSRSPTSYRSLLNYQPQSYSGRTVLLATEERRRNNSIIEWSQLVTERLDIRAIHGTHSIYIRDHAQTIGKILKSYLDDVFSSYSRDKITQASVKPLAAPHDKLETQLTKIWEEVLSTQPIGIHDNFFDIGGDSLLAVKLFLEINKAFDTTLSLATLFHAPSIEQLANFLRHGSCAESWSSIVPLQPNGLKKPLFLVHPCNGEVNMYRLLAQCLGPERPVYGLQYPGLDGGDLAFNRVELMASHYLNEIQTVQPTGPYYLGGKAQIGCLVALEMAQQLVSQGQKVELVIFFGGLGPLVLHRFSPEWTSRVIKRLHRHGLIYALRIYALRPIRQMKCVLTARASSLVIAFVRRFLSPSFLSPSDDMLIKQKTKSLLSQAVASYLPKQYFGRVVLFQPLEGYIDELPILAQKIRMVQGKLFVPFAQTFEIHDVPGSDNVTYTAYIEPHVRILADKLKVVLNATEACLGD
jgi:thioesterase domain-containing protein/acyl carrier protein